MAVTWHNAHFQIYHDKRHHRESYNGMINEENKPQASAAMIGSTLGIGAKNLKWQNHVLVRDDPVGGDR
jgi:hypothetical protein